jgi:hypothetical protein
MTASAQRGGVSIRVGRYCNTMGSGRLHDWHLTARAPAKGPVKLKHELSRGGPSAHPDGARRTGILSPPPALLLPVLADLLFQLRVALVAGSHRLHLPVHPRHHCRCCCNKGPPTPHPPVSKVRPSASCDPTALRRHHTTPPFTPSPSHPLTHSPTHHPLTTHSPPTRPPRLLQPCSLVALQPCTPAASLFRAQHNTTGAPLLQTPPSRTTSATLSHPHDNTRRLSLRLCFP